MKSSKIVNARIRKTVMENTFWLDLIFIYLSTFSSTISSTNKKQIKKLN